MKENYFFGQVKEEADRKKDSSKIVPITAAEHEETEEQPMTMRDYWLSLRQSIQDKIVPENQTPEGQEKTKLLSELITPDLMGRYGSILKNLEIKARKSDEHPQREFIDINSEEFSPEIEMWIGDLIGEVKSKSETGLDESDIEELRAQCGLLFDSIGNVMNTKSFERDIVEFRKDKAYKRSKEGDEKSQDEKAKEAEKSELVKDLLSRYPLDKAEVEILVDMIGPDNGKGDNYSPKILIETISRLWGEYHLGDRKGKIAKISLGYLMSKGAESFAPSLFQNMMTQDKFNVPVFLEYFGLDMFANVVDAKVEVELARVMNEINQQINERITNSLFFQEFEFIHEKPLGEIYATLERGKSATEQIIEDVISRFTPALTGITMSLIFLTKINPALGGISIASLPVMYRIAKKQNEKIMPMYEREKREGEKISTRLESIKSGFEEVKTSAETPAIAMHVKEQMDKMDALSLQRVIEQTKMRLKRMIPFEISTVIAACVGGAFQEAGMISGGAVLSNILYSERLNRPVQELVELYFNSFSRHIQDIQRMDEIFGEYDKLDLPEGEKEKDRVPVSELGNLDISVRNLKYKNILRGVNLDVKQGEFLTIAGVSGAGKSTLLRNIVGLYRPDGGEIDIGGVKNDQIKKYGDESIYSAMSYCNQDPQIFEGMTLRENLLLWSKKAVDDDKIKKVMIDLHLDKFIDKLDQEAKNLSGGEKVRVGVARTLIKGAKIMLLDEPTASLDSQAATEVRKIISEINVKYPDTTIICVTHDDELINAGDRRVNIADLQK